jgi:hypothetical protein
MDQRNLQSLGLFDDDMKDVVPVNTQEIFISPLILTLRFRSVSYFLKSSLRMRRCCLAFFSLIFMMTFLFLFLWK